MDPDDPNCPIRRQGLPLDDEALISHHDMHDPLHEDVDSPVPYITHRYPDRVLFIVTEMCPMYCRHCTRRRLVGSKEGSIPTPAIDRAMDYIRAHARDPGRADFGRRSALLGRFAAGVHPRRAAGDRSRRDDPVRHPGAGDQSRSGSPTSFAR